MNHQSEIDNKASLPEVEVNFKELLMPLWQKKWLLIICVFVVCSITITYLNTLNPLYKATAIIHISPIKQHTVSLDKAFNQTPTTYFQLNQQLQTQYAILRSREFAKRVLSKLNLLNNPEFQQGKYKPVVAEYLGGSLVKKNAEHIAALIQSRLIIEPIKDTELVKVSFIAYNPELASYVTNQIAEVYLSYKDELYNNAKKNTSRWLHQQIDKLSLKLKTSELALQEFREQESIIDINGVLGLATAEIKTLTLSYIQSVRERDDLAIDYRLVEKHKDDFYKLLELKPINSHPTIVKLLSNEELITRKIFELSKRYGPKHPKYISIKTELTSLKGNIEKQISSIVQEIQMGFFAAESKIRSIEQRLEQSKADYLRLSQLQNEFSQLEREVKSNKELYNTYLIKLKESDAMSDYNANFYIQVVDEAGTPGVPISPKKKLTIVMSFLATFILLSIVIYVREFGRDSLNSQRKLESFSDANILSLLPKHKNAGLTGDITYPIQDSVFIEAVRSLRTAILFNKQRKTPKLIAITSSIPREGKSTIAYQLASSFAEMEKVLLIEADLRNPSLAVRLGYSAHRPGLSNLIARTHTVSECLIQSNDNKLAILTSGITPTNPLAFLSMKQFSTLLRKFQVYYDRIVIEVPPINSVSDAIIVAQQADSTVYVAHAEKTKREQISNGLKILKQHKVNIEGVVINQNKSADTEQYGKDLGNIIKWPKKKHNHA